MCTAGYAGAVFLLPVPSVTRLFWVFEKLGREGKKARLSLEGLLVPELVFENEIAHEAASLDSVSGEKQVPRRRKPP